MLFSGIAREKIVTNQDALDAALSRTGGGTVYVNSPPDRWLFASSGRPVRLIVGGSSRVCLVSSWQTGSVLVGDDAWLKADGANVSLEFQGESRAILEGFARAVLNGNSAAVVAGAATATLYDRSRAVASGRAVIHIKGTLASVRATGSATVYADNGTVEASAHVAVHRTSSVATIQGGRIINHAPPSAKSWPPPVARWLAHHNVAVVDGAALLYKATDLDYTTGHAYGSLTEYRVGSEVVAPDWRDDHFCGGGLHLCPTPYKASTWRSGRPMRLLRCRVDVADIRTIDWAKAKVQRCFVEAKVDLFSDEFPV